MRRGGVNRWNVEGGGGSYNAGARMPIGGAAGAEAAGALAALGGVVAFVTALAKGGVERNPNEVSGGRIPAGATARIFTRRRRVPVVARTMLGAAMAMFLGRLGDGHTGPIAPRSSWTSGAGAFSPLCNVTALELDLANDIWSE